ncbi:helix-turn-helix transcriptional regulator [Cryobacterium sp. PH29-G1]|uniref:helix-turn-helix transcriptional regulator n=1 Tax=Cryobacterium sp. PH29-G1 TaxID=3046211 RepID=UPI0024BBA450|nr:helix-turn-helix transcriptional regulator [Cryobacterium sp. PH29-G1]MDJ0348390.1 helix-turn-helix transcriptional regulator [Cryobacterium sp. PH29-G1]
MKNLIAESRRSAGWSQEDLASRLSVSRQTVIALERGKYNPSLPVAFRLARIFGTTIEVLFQDDGLGPAEADPKPSE